MSILNIVGNEVVDNTLRDSGLDWQVELTNGLTTPMSNGSIAATSSKCATVRTDTNEILGIVSPDYKVVQNAELVHMAERVCGSQLNVNTGGTLRNGSRVWLGIKAPSFDVGTGDEVAPYLLLSNGHDGLFSLSGTPTSIRVWCENTLNMALADGRRQNMCISIRHKGNMTDKIEHLMETLEQFYARAGEFKRQAKVLAAKSMTEDDVTSYFKHTYLQHIDRIPYEVRDKSDERKLNKYRSTSMKWWKTFDEESSRFDPSLWVAYNAVTRWIDHDATFRGPNKIENRFLSNFYGGSATKKQMILESTLSGV